MSTALGLGALGMYFFLLVTMLLYGVNSVVMVVVHALNRHRAAPAPPVTSHPRVTIQLAVYNEANVVERLLEACARIRWPRERLQIQLLDDSTDHTPEVAAPVVARLRAEGLDVEHRRRVVRRDYKAGALQEALSTATGEFIAMFDADFVPPEDFLERSIGRFADPALAAVQGRWTHLNRDHSPLTRAQALAIDGHFGVEQGARDWMGWFLNFNGTGGVWRRTAIEDGGGWTGDTLTEDLDLSYRVQLRGWRIAYDADLTCPSELPTQLSGFKSQQRRWATGSMQTALKLLPAVWRSEHHTLVAKVQATLHLTHYAVHVLIALTALLSVPCVWLPGNTVHPPTLWTLVVPFLLAMTGPTIQHAYAQLVLEKSRIRLSDFGMLTLLGIGIAVSNARAVAEAFRSPGGEFVRTPKHGIGGSGPRRLARYALPSDGLQPLEALLAAYCLFAVGLLLVSGRFEIVPFLALDAAGFGYVALLGRGAEVPA